MRKIDQFGRVSLPRDVMREMGWKQGDSVEINQKDETMLITKSSQFLKFQSLYIYLLDYLADITATRAVLVFAPNQILRSSNAKDIPQRDISEVQKTCEDLQTVLYYACESHNGYHIAIETIEYPDKQADLLLLSSDVITIETNALQQATLVLKVLLIATERESRSRE